MIIYAMRRFWFKTLLAILAVSGLGAGLILAPGQAEAYQEASTPTGVLATIIYAEQINVRSGPSTVNYPVIGQLFPGDIVPALGISKGREWIQISYSSGVGWVYASFVSISGGELRIVEPPPTPTPLVTATIDPTLAAAFNIEPTQTRIPTFTPPPPLDVPQFTEVSSSSSSGAAFGIFIIILVIIGGVGLVFSYVIRS
jgi:uncharacterized protein YraI